jgi:hypothetical protein
MTNKAAVAISVTALVFAASGVGFAASSINGRSIQNGSISSAKLTRSLQNELINKPATSAVTYLDVVSNPAPVDPGTASTGWSLCPAGFTAIGGGAATTGDVVIMNDAPYAGISQGVHVVGWQAAVQDIGTSEGTVSIVAVCAS